MGEPFLAEIRVVSFNFAPKGWAMCNGQSLPINQNQALFSLLGTIYGGNGQTTFALPNLQGRVPIHVGAGHTLGERAGTENHTLTVAEIPAHTHTLSATGNNATADTPAGNVLASVTNGYAPLTNPTAMGANAIVHTGSQLHNNMAPYLTLTFVIALQGIYPSPN